VTVSANAKVNLTLEVYGRRPDGYHALRSLVAPISLADTIDIEVTEDGRLTSDTGFPDDLCVKAACALARAAGQGQRSRPTAESSNLQPSTLNLQPSLGARIRVTKRIPVGGGLGGGSADAAATLRALNELWNLGKTPEELAEIGAAVGSDVPALVLAQHYRRVVLMEGRGERVAPLFSSAFVPQRHLVLANPGISVSTAEVYRFCEPRTEPADGAVNDLESPAVSRHPEIAQTLSALRAAGATGVMMSGSGATCFGFAADAREAARIAREVSSAGNRCWCCQSLAEAPRPAPVEAALSGNGAFGKMVKQKGRSRMKLQVLACAALASSVSFAWEMGDPIVTYWAGPGYGGSKMAITDESLKLLKDGGFNLVWATTKEELDLAAKWGLRGIGDLKIGRGKNLDPNDCEKFKQRLSSLKDHPALYIYHQCDEPPASWFDGLAADSRIARSVDPKHPTWVNLLPTYANNRQLGLEGEIISAYREHVRLFLETYDPAFVSYDHYQLNNGWDTSNYFLNLSIVQQACAARGIPFMNGVQAAAWWPPKSFASPAAPRIPGPDEMRYLVYTTLAYGAQGIYYYVYSHPGHQGSIVSQDGVPDAKYFELKKLNPIFVAMAKQLRGHRFMGAYFKGFCPRGGTPYGANALLTFADGAASQPLPEKKELTDSVLVSRFDAPDGSTRLMVVNVDYRKERTLEITAPSAVLRFDPATGSWQPLGKAFTLNLARGEGALLCL